jgi:hypothetical protein
MAFNIKDNRLCAFYGQKCNGITADGKSYRFADRQLDNITFGPVNGSGTHYRLYASGAGEISIPAPPTAKKASAKVGGKSIPASLSAGTLTLKLTQEQYGRPVDININ